MVHAAGRLSGERVSELHSSEIWSVALFATPTGINETPVNKPQPLALCGGLSAHCSLAFHASHADARADARACNFLMDVAYRCKNRSRRMQLLPYAGLSPLVVSPRPALPTRSPPCMASSTGGG